MKKDLRKYKDSISDILSDFMLNDKLKNLCTCDNMISNNGIIEVCSYHMTIFSLEESLRDISELMKKNDIDDDDLTW